MNEKLRSAFDNIHAGDDLKDSTREFLFYKTSGYAGRRNSIQRNLMVAAACLMFMLAGFGGGYWAYFTPVSAISIDINPSIEFSINRFGRVLSVESFNDDGTNLASALDVRFMGYVDAIDQVLNNETIIDCLARNEVLSIMVVSSDGERQKEMLVNVERCVAGHNNVHCGAGNYEDVSTAHTQGLSVGKYRAFLELQALDPSIMPEDIQGWTMREIRDRIDALSRTAPDNSQGEPGHHGQGGGHGHRNGWGTASQQN